MASKQKENGERTNGSLTSAAICSLKYSSLAIIGCPYVGYLERCLSAAVVVPQRSAMWQNKRRVAPEFLRLPPGATTFAGGNYRAQVSIYLRIIRLHVHFILPIKAKGARCVATN